MIKMVFIKNYLFFLFLITFLFTQCTIEPENIKYNEEACTFCKMMISDPIHGAELVTDKGKIYKFDALECLVNYYKKNSNDQYLFIVSNTYEEPKKLIDIRDLTILKSEKLKSPMGENLTVFQQRENILSIDSVGKILSWSELLELNFMYE